MVARPALTARPKVATPAAVVRVRRGMGPGGAAAKASSSSSGTPSGPPTSTTSTRTGRRVCAARAVSVVGRYRVSPAVTTTAVTGAVTGIPDVAVVGSAWVESVSVMTAPSSDAVGVGPGCDTRPGPIRSL